MSTQATNVEIIESDCFEANGENMTVTTRKRVLAKTLLWRVIATLTGAVIAASLNPEAALETAGWFIIIEFPLKMAFYYMHERGWEMVTWGMDEEIPATDSA